MEDTRILRQVDIHLSGSVMRLVLTSEQTDDLLSRHGRLRRAGEEWFIIGDELFIDLDEVQGIHVQSYEKPLWDGTQELLKTLVRK